jgi:hypothetical protein
LAAKQVDLFEQRLVKVAFPNGRRSTLGFDPEFCLRNAVASGTRLRAMDLRRIELALSALLIVVSGAGCKKSGPVAGAPSASSAGTVARIHWLGKKQLAAGTNAAALLDIWNLPESAKLEAQTLDKLSLAPWRLLRGEAATTNAPGALLRPLLGDAVQEECYVEVRAATNQPGELAFAIRLSDERARLWETNLAAALESLTGIRPSPAAESKSLNPQPSTLNLRQGWSLKKHQAPNLIELVRAGEWTLVGAAQDTNATLGDLLARLQRDRTPVAAPATNSWLEADLDLRWLASALSIAWSPPEGWPTMSVAVTGDGQSVRTSGKFDFPRPLALELEPWNIPTNLIQEPLVNFTALRGIRPWLASLKTWNDLQLGAPPDQLYCWALQGIPLQIYFAAPLPDATNQVKKLTGLLVKKVNPWLATNGMGSFESSQDSNSVTLTGIPFLSPSIQSVAVDGIPFGFGGLFPSPGTNQPPPGELLLTVSSWPNLVFYEWEITGPRVQAWIYLSQTFRLITHYPQLPIDSAGLTLLKNVGSKLGNCVTTVTKTGPGQISFIRQSSAGFTALELHLLADWLESPQFPRGLHTFLAPPDMPPPGSEP